MTAEVGAKSQPTIPPPPAPQGVVTRARSSAYRGAPALTNQPPPPPAQMAPVPQDPTTFDVPPLPGESTHPSSPIEGSPTLLGPTASDDGFQQVSRARGRRTPPYPDAIPPPPPDPAPMAIVDRYAVDNSESSLSDDKARDNTLSTSIPAAYVHEGNPAPPADPSLQAALDNIWPRSEIPGVPEDPTMTRLRDFVSESGKKLDSAIHSFRQEQLEHDSRVDSIIQDIRADRLDPDSFVSTQEFNHRVTTILDAVAPLPPAVKALEAKYDAVYTKFQSSFLSTFTASLVQLESELKSMVTSHLVDVVATNHTLGTTINTLDTHVSSLDTRLAEVESSLAKVEISTNKMVADIQDMGASLTSLLTRPPPVTPNPSPVPPARDDVTEVEGNSSMASGPPLDIPAGPVGGSSHSQASPPHVHWTSSTGNRWTNVDPTSLSSGARNLHVRVSPQVDTTQASTEATHLPPTPRTVENRRRQAIKDGLSRFDFAALCDPHYHGGPDGLSLLTIESIRVRGYTSINSDDVVLCFNDIINLHSKVLASWTNARTQQSGPTIERIVEKAVPTILPKLEGLSAAELVLWYDNLQKISSVYLLPLMPFDAINLRLGFEGLCPPGLGCLRYADICRAMMEVFPRLLPNLNRVSTVVSTTRAENGNGYSLVWEVMALAVPGFDPTLHAPAPVWEDFMDILDFAHAHLLYFRLQAKVGLYYDSRKKSSTFLRTLQHTEYVDVVLLLQTSVETYLDPYDDGYLPTHLCLMGLALRLEKNRRSHIREVLPRVRRIQGASPEPSYDDEFTPRIYRTDLSGRGRDHQNYGDRPGGRRGRDAHGSDRGFGRSRFPDRGRDSAPRGRYARPDHNRRVYDKDVQCDACKRVGHSAATCDVLAQALFLTKYMKYTLDDKAKANLEAAWLDRWSSKLGAPSRTPRTVMRAYLEDMDLSLDDLDAQMCWECWPPDDTPFEEVEITSA